MMSCSIRNVSLESLLSGRLLSVIVWSFLNAADALQCQIEPIELVTGWL